MLRRRLAERKVSWLTQGREDLDTSVLGTKQTKTQSFAYKCPATRSSVWQVSLMAERGTGQPRRRRSEKMQVGWRQRGEVFDFILLDHILLEFHRNQNTSQKHVDLAELADSDQKYLLCLF